MTVGLYSVVSCFFKLYSVLNFTYIQNYCNIWPVFQKSVTQNDCSINEYMTQYLQRRRKISIEWCFLYLIMIDWQSEVWILMLTIKWFCLRYIESWKIQTTGGCLFLEILLNWYLGHHWSIWCSYASSNYK